MVPPAQPGSWEIRTSAGGDTGVRIVPASDPPSVRDQEELRWYAEDFPLCLPDLVRATADRIRDSWAAKSRELYEALGVDIEEPWRTTVQISLPESTAASYPWELLQSGDGSFLARNGLSIIRTPPSTLIRESSNAPVTGARVFSLLLIISRGDDEMPFRTVAGGLVRMARRSGSMRITILRPPSLHRLREVLRGEPFDAVHFDGHGSVGEGRGWLWFGDQKVTGERFAGILREGNVGRLVLNACRSAFVEPFFEPSADVENPLSPINTSLAAEVLAAGIEPVVAMRYNVFDRTAQEFVAGLYETLAQGAGWTEAVASARANVRTADLHWSVPVLYQRRLETRPAGVLRSLS